MTKDQVKKQLILLVKDLEKANRRCQKLSKALGIVQNTLVQESLNEVNSLIEYIESLEVDNESRQ